MHVPRIKFRSTVHSCSTLGKQDIQAKAVYYKNSVYTKTLIALTLTASYFVASVATIIVSVASPAPIDTSSIGTSELPEMA